MKSLFKRRGYIAIGAICILAVGFLFFFKYDFHRSTIKIGPYAKQLKNSSTNWTRTGYSGKVGAKIFLGGVPFEDKQHIPYQILSVKPTNLKNGLTLNGATVLSLPPAVGIGPLNWIKNKVHQHFLSLPVTRTSSSKHMNTEPGIIVKPTRPGFYVINGFLVKYKWGSKTYQDYIPNQFTLCIGETNNPSCKDRKVSPPPKNWTKK